MRSRRVPGCAPGRRAILALMLAFPAVLLPVRGEAQWVLGAQGGFPGYSVAGRAPEDASYGRQFRVAASAVIGYRIGSSVVLRVEPGLVQKGAGVSYDVDGVEDPVDSLSLNLDYLSVPLVVQVFTPGGRGFVTSGFEFGRLSSAAVSTVGGQEETDVKDLLESQDVAWLFGAGGLVRRSSPQVSLELRYAQSLGTVFEGQAGDSGLPTALRSSGFTLMAGVSWTLGGNR